MPERGTTETPECHCLRCGDTFNRASYATGTRAPRGGDVAMCVTCGTFHIFKDDLTVRAPTANEMRDMVRDPEVRFWSAMHAAYRRERVKQ